MDRGRAPYGIGHLMILYRKHVLNKLQTYCDGRFNMVVHFYTPYDQTVDRWQTSPNNCN